MGVVIWREKEEAITRVREKRIGRGRPMREMRLRLAVTMLVTTAAFIVVAHPPVAVADLLVAANTGSGQPEHSTDEDA